MLRYAAMLVAVLLSITGPNAGAEDRTTGQRHRAAENRPAHLGVDGITESNQEGPCIGKWKTQAQVARGIRCVWARFEPGEGGVREALDVARCESGLDPDAYGNGNAGVFQHNLHYWDGRFERFIEGNKLRTTWRLSSSAYSGRTNAIVTALMVRRGDWSPWSGCA